MANDVGELHERDERDEPDLGLSDIGAPQEDVPEEPSAYEDFPAGDGITGSGVAWDLLPEDGVGVDIREQFAVRRPWSRSSGMTRVSHAYLAIDGDSDDDAIASPIPTEVLGDDCLAELEALDGRRVHLVPRIGRGARTSSPVPSRVSATPLDEGDPASDEDPWFEGEILDDREDALPQAQPGMSPRGADGSASPGTLRLEMPPSEEGVLDDADDEAWVDLHPDSPGDESTGAEARGVTPAQPENNRSPSKVGESSRDRRVIINHREPPALPTNIQAKTPEGRDTLRVMKVFFAANERFRPRPAQWAMTSTIADALAGVPKMDTKGEGTRPVVVIEAGTGTGKSIGYLIPALTAGARTGRPVIVVTHTLALQHQLATVDLPRLLQGTGLNLRVSVARGRTNFACNASLNALSDGQGGLFPDSADGPWMALRRAQDEKRWNGEIDTAPVPLSDGDRKKLTAGHNGCAGRSCSLYESCHYQRSLNERRDAHVVIANHSLLMADLVTKGGLLPRAAESILVIDEGHHLEDVASAMFSARLVPADLQRLINSTRKLVDRSVSAGDAVNPTISETLLEAESITRHIGTTLDARAQGSEGREVIVDLREEVALRESLASLSARFADIARALSAQELGAGEGTDPKSALARAGRAFNPFLTALRSFTPPDDERAPAVWIEVPRGEGGAVLSSRPIDVSARLWKSLWSKAQAVVIASATFSTLGRFDVPLRRLGLDRSKNVLTRTYPSPFDYSKSRIVIARGAVHPPSDAASNDSYVKALSRQLSDIVSPDGGSLFLFTSRALMTAVRQEMHELLGCSIQMQGDAPIGTIVRRHRSLCRARHRSVLLGLDSMSEGLDLPGNECNVVAITRLPFKAPSGAYERIVADAVESAGGSAFRDIALPAAAIKFKQMLGRLVRTERDSGVIWIFDSRIVETKYGIELLTDAPPFPVFDARHQSTLAPTPAAARAASVTDPVTESPGRGPVTATAALPGAASPTRPSPFRRPAPTGPSR